jgi:hypothetical protein
MPRVIKSAQAPYPKPAPAKKQQTPAPLGARIYGVNGTTFSLLQWGPALAVGILLASSVLVGIWLAEQAHYAQAGHAVCRHGIMPEPEVLCDMGEVACITDPVEGRVERIRQVIYEHNLRVAKACA